MSAPESATQEIRDYFAGARWKASAGRRYLMTERHELLRRAVARLERPVSELSICDIGCGTGMDLQMWREHGVLEAHLAGTELIPIRADAARAALPTADIRKVEGFKLPFASASFTVTSASLVLSTILGRDHRRELLAEMRRITVPGGLVVVYDFAIRKPWNRNVRPISTRELSGIWRRPDLVVAMAPFLPALDMVLRAPRRAHAAIRLLPRTHRVWTWRLPPR